MRCWKRRNLRKRRVTSATNLAGGTAVGAHNRIFPTTSGAATRHVPQLKGAFFEPATIGRQPRRGARRKLISGGRVDAAGGGHYGRAVGRYDISRHAQ